MPGSGSPAHLSAREAGALFAGALLLRLLALRPGLPPAPPEALLVGPDGGAALLVLRLLSVVTGSLAAVLAARAGGRLGGRTGAWTAGGLLALTPFAVRHSGWLGPPGLLVLAASGGLLQLVRWRDDRRLADAAGIAAWGALAALGLVWAPLTNTADPAVASPLLEGLRLSARGAGVVTFALAAAGALLALRPRPGAARAVLGTTLGLLVVALLRGGADRYALGVVLPGVVLLAAAAVARAPARLGRVALAAALVAACVGTVRTIAASRGRSPSRAAAEWTMRHVPTGSPVLVEDRGVELPPFVPGGAAKGFHAVPLPGPDAGPEERPALYDPALAREFPWMVLRDPSASASRASRDFHRFFAEEWTQAARFGADAYPATPVTVLRRPDGWEPDSARVAEVEERLGALAAVRDTSTALTEWILRAGEALRGSGRLDGAGVLLAAALERRPDDAEILFEVGLTHLLKQEWDEAMYAMFDALRIDPHHGPAQYNLGTLLEREGDLNGAETAYRAAILYLDDPAPAHGRLGALLAKRGELNEARAELEIVQRIDPLGEDARLLKRAIAEAERSDP
jgi:hypothetical protein